MTTTTIDLTALTDDELDTEEKRASAAEKEERATDAIERPAWRHYIAVITEQNERCARARGYASAEEQCRSPEYTVQILDTASAHLSNAAYLLKHRDEIDNNTVERARSLYQLGMTLLESFAERPWPYLDE